MRTVRQMEKRADRINRHLNQLKNELDAFETFLPGDLSSSYLDLLGHVAKLVKRKLPWR